MTVHTWADNDRLYAADLNSSFQSVIALNGCRASKAAVQSLTTAVATKINFDTEDRDDGGFHSNVTNNTRMTVPVAGWYDFGATISFASNATGYRSVGILYNNTALLAIETRVAVTGASTQITISGSKYFIATDYIEVQATQTSGGNLNVEQAFAYTPIFWIAARRGT